MAMTVGGARKGVTPQMNVTPLVDVVLVLLIIFMVITPLLSKQFWVHIPKQEREEVTPQQLESEPVPPLVLRVAAGRRISVNGAELPFELLSARLRRMVAALDDHVLFFDAADDAEYGFTVEGMDRAREGGAVTIATLAAGLQGAEGAAAEQPDTAPSAPPR